MTSFPKTHQDSIFPESMFQEIVFGSPQSDIQGKSVPAIYLPKNERYSEIAPCTVCFSVGLTGSFNHFVAWAMHWIVGASIVDRDRTLEFERIERSIADLEARLHQIAIGLKNGLGEPGNQNAMAELKVEEAKRLAEKAELVDKLEQMKRI